MSVFSRQALDGGDFENLLMGAIEIFLGVLFPLFVGTGIALATAGTDSGEFVVARVCFVIAAIDAAALTVWWIYSSRSHLGPLIAGSAVGVVLLVGLPAALWWIDAKANVATEKADVTLRFVYPSEPALELVNVSNKVAKDIKYTVVLWNRDLPDRRDPLPIPIATFDFLRGRGIGGPQNLFGPVSSLIKPGDRLFGSASVSSAEGARGHTFMVYIVWGEGGWFSEIQSVDTGSILAPAHFTTPEISRYLESIQKIAERDRTPIRDRTIEQSVP